MFKFATTIDAGALARLLGKPNTGDADEVARVLAVAVAHLTDATAQAWRPIPAEVCDDLVIRVARSVWDGSHSPQGGASTQLGGEQVVRSPRDPLATVRPVLERYVAPF